MTLQPNPLSAIRLTDELKTGDKAQAFTCGSCGKRVIILGLSVYDSELKWKFGAKCQCEECCKKERDGNTSHNPK